MKNIDVVCEMENDDPDVGIFGFEYRAYAKNITSDESVCSYHLSEPHFRWSGERPPYAKVVERTLEAYVNALLEDDSFDRNVVNGPDTEPPITLDDPNREDLKKLEQKAYPY